MLTPGGDPADVVITGQAVPLEVISPGLTEPEHAARGAVIETERVAQVAEGVAAAAVTEGDRATQESEAVARARADALELLRVGQRRINLIWEVTQAAIAVMVIGFALIVVGTILIHAALTDQLGQDVTLAAFVFLSNLPVLIVGFYFSRTNHQNVGGVSPGDTGR